METLVGKTATAAAVAGPDNSAAAMGSGDLPVFATPALVALMEQAAVACLAGQLEAGQTTVGTHIAVDHTAASAAGARVTATVTVTAVEGRQISFAITAQDEAGPVGKATHTRFVVNAARFMEKAAGRG